MTDYNQFHDSFADVPPPAKKMPDMINVLTILTFIWSAVSFLQSFYAYFSACASVETIRESMDKVSSNKAMSNFMDMDKAVAMAQKSCEMRLPIFLVALAASILCFVGAFMMRKLKKTGFYLYVVGEIVLPIVSVAIIGLGMMGGFVGMVTMIMYIIPITFVILYATQLKHMK